LFLEQFLDPQIFDQQIGKIEKEESSYRIGGSGSDQISSLNRLLPYSWRCAVFSNQDLRSDSAGEIKGQRSSRTDLARSDRQSYKKKRGAASDEDTIMDHADFNCLSWKEILSLIDDYYKVNSFLIERMS
jgi:hypothetical protein